MKDLTEEWHFDTLHKALHYISSVKEEAYDIMQSSSIKNAKGPEIKSHENASSTQTFFTDNKKERTEIGKSNKPIYPCAFVKENILMISVTFVQV